MKNTRVLKPDLTGQDFDVFLREDGIAAEVEVRAIKKMMMALLQGAGLTQLELATRLQTSRSQVRRLLDPDNTSITLSTLQHAAEVAGHRVVIGFEPVRRRAASRRKIAANRPAVPADTLDLAFMEQHVAQAKAAWRKHAQSKTWEEKIAAIERMWERDAALKQAREANLAQRRQAAPAPPD